MLDRIWHIREPQLSMVCSYSMLANIYVFGCIQGGFRGVPELWDINIDIGQMLYCFLYSVGKYLQRSSDQNPGYLLYIGDYTT